MSFIAITADSRINLTNTLGLLRLGEIHLSATKKSLSSCLDVVPRTSSPAVLPFAAAAAAARRDDSDEDDNDFDQTADDDVTTPLAEWLL